MVSGWVCYQSSFNQLQKCIILGPRKIHISGADTRYEIPVIKYKQFGYCTHVQYFAYNSSLVNEALNVFHIS